MVRGPGSRIIHQSRERRRWLTHSPKFRVIYQPVYSPIMLQACGRHDMTLSPETISVAQCDNAEPVNHRLQILINIHNNPGRLSRDFTLRVSRGFVSGNHSRASPAG